MSLYEASGTLAKAFKDLLTKWEQAKTTWDDAPAQAFERETLATLEKDVRAAAEAMDQMKLVIGAAKRDCSPG